MSQPPNRELGVDVARGLGVLGVVVVHSVVSRGASVPAAGVEAAGLSIVVLFLLMGVVLGMGVGDGRWSSGLGWSAYVRDTRRRLDRFAPGFVVAWLVTLVLGLAAGTLLFGPATLVGMLPVPGPGNYFVPVLAAWILITPVIVWGSERSIPITVGLLVLADVAWWPLVAWRLPHFWAWGWVGGWGMMFGAGLWIGAHDVRRVRPAVAIGAVVLMVAYLATSFRAWLLPVSVGVDSTFNELVHHAGMTLYSAAFVAVAVAVGSAWPRNALMRIGVRIGRATWPVYLVNMVWFGALSTWFGGSGYWWVPVDVAVCVLGGVGLFELEGRMRARATRSG